jgi:hypothetical protein
MEPQVATGTTRVLRRESRVHGAQMAQRSLLVTVWFGRYTT